MEILAYDLGLIVGKDHWIKG